MNSSDLNKDTEVESLFRQIAAGDEKAFSQVHSRYKTQLLAYAKKYLPELSEAQDTVSESFIALWKWRQNLQSDAHLRNFLFITVRRNALNQLLARQRYENLLNKSIEEADGTGNIDPEEIEVELLHLLRQAVKELPPEYKQVFELSYDRQFSPGEIARILQMNPATVRTQKKRAIQMIKDRIKKLVPVIIWILHHLPV